MIEYSRKPTFVNLAEASARAKRREGMTTDFTYGDVMVHPRSSVVRTLDEVDLSTELAKGITLKIPIISANMDTVTEAPMAIFMARIGGIGIIHRAMPIDEQVRQIKSVKRATQYIVEDPPRLSPTDSVQRAQHLMEEHERGYVIVTDERNELLGLASTRDVHGLANPDWDISRVMTPRDRLVVAPPGISMADAQQRMYDRRVEKLPLIDPEGRIAGVITDRDLMNLTRYTNATKDSKGRLRVGAAIGTENGSIERAQALIESGTDIIVVDVLHGDSDAVIETIKKVASIGSGIPIMAGNVAMPESTKRLINAGADSVKVGYGPGAVCTTRLVTGTGRPQFSAVIDSAAAAYDHRRKIKRSTINADGNIRKGGDAVKALAAGADHIMVGSLLAGTDESPGEVILDEETGRRSKIYSGMASERAQQKLAAVRGGKAKKRAAQGTTTSVPYVGSAEVIIDKLVGGIQSGIANAGAKNIIGLQEVVSFGKQTMVGYAEGTPHGKK